MCLNICAIVGCGLRYARYEEVRGMMIRCLGNAPASALAWSSSSHASSANRVKWFVLGATKTSATTAIIYTTFSSPTTGQPIGVIKVPCDRILDGHSRESFVWILQGLMSVMSRAIQRLLFAQVTGESAHGKVYQSSVRVVGKTGKLRVICPLAELNSGASETLPKFCGAAYEERTASRWSWNRHPRRATER